MSLKYDLQDLEVFRKTDGSHHQQSVIFLHGSPGSYRDLSDHFLKDISFRFDFLTYHRPGFGKSAPSKQPLSLADHAKLLKELIDQRRISRPILVGHSWGARLALEYAIRFPNQLSGLGLVAPYIFPRATEKSLKRILALVEHPFWGSLALPLLTKFVGRKALSKNLKESSAPQNLDNEKLSERLARISSASSFQEVLREKEAFMDAPLRDKDLARVRVRTSILAGQDDLVTPQSSQGRAVFSLLKDAVITTPHATGHDLTHFGADQWFQMIESIFEETNSPSQGEYYATTH